MSDELAHEVHINLQISAYGFNDDVNSLINITNTLLGAGAFVFPQIAGVQGTVSTVGGIIKSILATINPDDPKPDPVLESLKTLEKKLNELAYKMAGHFADMKEFISEVNFLTTITVPTTNLMRFMQDCMKSPSQEALANFKSAYEDRKPLKIAYDMLSLLEHEKTNPLRMAMAADPLRTRTTFEACGLLKGDEKNPLFDSNLLIDRANKLHKTMDGWKEEYKKDPTYFGALQKYVEEFMDKHPDLNFGGVADKLRDSLNDILLTNDILYIVMFSEPATEKNYEVKVKNASQLIEVRNHGGKQGQRMVRREDSEKHRGGAVIYRSSQGRFAKDEDIEDLDKKVKYLAGLIWMGPITFKGQCDGPLNKYFTNAGICMLIDYFLMPQFRIVNGPDGAKKPAFWTYIQTEEALGIWGRQMYQLVAFL